jgi:hypothetical protein
MFVTDAMFFHLVQCGLADKLVKTFKDADRKKTATTEQLTGQKHLQENDDDDSSDSANTTPK